MNNNNLEVYGSVLATSIAVFGALKWILQAKINPLSEKINENSDNLSDLDRDMEKVKQEIKDQLMEIATQNFDFRLSEQKKSSEMQEKLQDFKIETIKMYATKDEIEKLKNDMERKK